MAIYHFNLTVITRSKGQSVVKAVATAFGEKLHDDRINKTYNYLNKRNGLVYKETILPPYRQDWMKDRSRLWNYVEQNEKRKDARLARKFGMALPNELEEKINIELAREYVHKYFVKVGMIADLCIYYARDNKDLYLTVFTTLRKIQGEGFGLKVVEWDRREALLLWRERWAELVNIYLAKHGYSNQKITHKSLEAQGIPLIPLGKTGAKAAWDRLTDLADKRISGITENEKVLLKYPEIILYALLGQYEEFGEGEIDGFIKRNTCSEESFHQVKNMVMQSPYSIAADGNSGRFKVDRGSD